jgi:hypothetical protein
MLRDLLTTYWSQVTLILVGIGFFIQRIYNLRSKKSEIRYSLFQENRLTAVRTFFSSYAIVTTMWHQLPIYQIFKREIKATEMDKLIWPPLNALHASILELKIYFSDNDHKTFELIYDNFLKINRVMGINYSDSDRERHEVHKVNDFEDIRLKVAKENSALIDQIGVFVRYTFK